MNPEKPDISSLRIARHESDSNSSSGNIWKYLVPLLLIALVTAGFLILRSALSPAAEVETTSASLTYPAQANAVLTANGYVVAQRKAAVASKGTGRLVYLGVEEGDHVVKGQVIGRLEDQDVVAALAKARADMAVAQADSFDATTSLHREQALYDARLASKADLDAAEARYLRTMASIGSARAAVDGAEVALEYTRIRAPFDGTVLTKDADVGEVVAPFAASANSRGAIVSMADMNSLQVEADVSESNITRVRVGQPCEITLDAYPDTRYRGVVHKIVPTADRAKATVLTKVAFTDRDERVLPDMSAKVAFLSSPLSDSAAAAPPKLTIPATALIERDGRSLVLAVGDGVVKEVQVRTGARMGSLVEITEGLSQGETIVNRPPAGLSSGAKVKAR